MKKIKWTQKFTVNIDEIDNQHRQFLDITNDLIQSFVKGGVENDFANYLRLLRRYAHVHFETEEQYIKEHAPELLKEQQEEHQKFEEALKLFFRDFLNNKEAVQIDTLKFLIDWVKNHILDVDKKYERAETDHHELNSLIDWDDTMSVKVEKMDDQHKYLIHMLNTLHTAILNKKTADQLDKIIDELVLYTKEHFSVEEEYMAAAEYPGLEHQKKEHQEFIDMISECNDSLHLNKRGLAMDLVKYLLKWFNTHILESDRKYTEALNKKGIK